MTIFVLSAAFLAGLAFRELVRFVAWLADDGERPRAGRWN